MNYKRLLYNVCRSSQCSVTVFRNFKNQSQRFITIFRNFKNQSQRFMTIFDIMYRYKSARDTLGRV